MKEKPTEIVAGRSWLYLVGATAYGSLPDGKSRNQHDTGTGKMNDVPIGELTLEKFSTVLGTKFRVVREPAPPLDLKLVEAAAMGDGRSAAVDRAGFRQDAFSLHFNGPADPLLPQRIYRVEHDRIGRFDLFLVPVGREAGAVRYQVIFNRLIKAA